MLKPRPNILKIQPYEPGKPIDEVKRELGLRQIVKLASNENPLGPSPKAARAIRNYLSQIHRYPDGGCFYLKKALAEFLKINPVQLILGNGSNEIIELVARAYLTEEDEVLLAEPSFLVYRLIVEAIGVRAVTVALKNFRYDLAGMAQKLNSKIRVVFIANPDNPTGTYVSDKELNQFIEKVSQEATLVVLDEAYREFVDADDFPQSFRYLDRGNVLILRTFSKAFGLAGLRIGYGVGSPSVIESLHRVRQPFNVNSLAQIAALSALRDGIHLQRTQKTVWEGKKFWYRSLEELGLRYIPTQANFILVDVQCDGTLLFQKMLRSGVIIRDMRAYGLNQYVRITIGTQQENQKCLLVLKKRLKEMINP